MVLVIISCLLAMIHSARASGEHGHDHAGAKSCRDLATDKGWAIDCDNVTPVNNAHAYLTANTKCKALESFEWSGIFAVSGATQTWTMAKKDGKYADPSMKVVLFSTTAVTSASSYSLEASATTLIKGTCENVTAGALTNGITTSGKCFEWRVDDASAVSSFEINTAGITGLAAYTAHSPYEFEADEHYLKDSSGADVEHVAEDSACKNNYWLMQMHHDHCPHNALDKSIELDFHDFEAFYTDCEIERLYDPTKDTCPSVSCSSVNVDLANAVKSLNDENCDTACSSTVCINTFQRILMAHDTCEESQLPTDLEEGLHTFEDACGDHLCNVYSPASKLFTWKLTSAVVGSAFFFLF